MSHSESYIGECVTFQCTLNGTAQWKLNGTDISNHPHYNIDITSRTLTIQEVKSTDSGDYTCGSGIIPLIVKSKYHYLYLNYPFLVPDIKVINVTDHYTNLHVGSSVSINCTTMPSIPNSEIKWHSSLFNSDSNELIINPVMLSHNNNTFTCVVSSDLLAMNLTKSITISVLG